MWCKTSFTRAADFRASFISRGRGLCFVAHEGDLNAEVELSIKVMVAGQAPIELAGRVQRADFDEQGNAGVLVELAAASVTLVAELDARLVQLAAPAPARSGVSAINPALPASSRSGITPALPASSRSGITPALPGSPTSKSGRRMPAITAPTVPVVGAPAPPPAPQLPLSALVSPAIAARLEANRQAALLLAPPEGVFVFAEIEGPALEDAPGRACLGRVLEAVAVHDGFVEGREGASVLVGFVSPEGLPAGRAAAALLAARDGVADEAESQGVPAQLKAGMVAAGFLPRGGSLERARSLCAELRAGQLGCERSLEDQVGQVAEIEDEPFGGLITARTAAPVPPPGLVGCASLLEAIDRRLAGITEPGVGILLRGAAGSGRTTVATEIAELGRQRGLAVTAVTAFDSWKKIPAAGLAAIACAACDVPFELRATRLRPALESLGLPAPFLEALLSATQVVQHPWPFTTGQSAHALRALLHSKASERPMLILVEGLEHLDELSLETFVDFSRRPWPRALTIGLTSSDFPASRFEGLMVAELPKLSAGEVEQLVERTVGGAPGPRLAAHLAREGRELPGVVQDWLHLLVARGAIAHGGGGVELVEAPPALTDEALLAARFEFLAPDAAHALEAAWCQGDSFEPALVAAAWPRLTQAALQSLAALRLIRPSAGKRWAFCSSRVRAAVGAAASKERRGVQQRLAAALALQAKTEPSSVDPVEVARAWVAAGDGPRAVQASQDAVDAALARRAPRDAAVALRVLCRALGLVAAPVHLRVEALTRAVGCSLVALDVPGARALMDEALVLAQPTQLETAELLLGLSRLSRLEGHPDHSNDVLERAEFMAGGTPLETLLHAERGELWELAGQTDKAVEAISASLATAEAGHEISRLHGEADLAARLEARLGALAVSARDAAGARQHFERSANRWRASGLGQAEARALSNLASACALAEDFGEAVKCFGAAATTAARCGDFLFQARALLGQARVLKRLQAPELKAVAGEAWKIAGAIGWGQGRTDAEALVSAG